MKQALSFLLPTILPTIGYNAIGLIADDLITRILLACAISLLSASWGRWQAKKGL